MMCRLVFLYYYLDWISCPLPSAALQQQHRQPALAPILLRLADRLTWRQLFVELIPVNTVSSTHLRLFIVTITVVFMSQSIQY
jgi:hypothetical protein